MARISPMAAPGNRLGVPPPKNTLVTLRPHTSGRFCSRSRVNAARYSATGSSFFLPCELKSQYGHFFTHHGMCTYSASGGGINSGMRGQFFAQLRQRAAAVADAVLELGRQLRGAAAVFGVEEDQVVA